jgi:hypothetical protein
MPRRRDARTIRARHTSGKQKGGPSPSMTAELLKQAFRAFGVGLRRRLSS